MKKGSGVFSDFAIGIVLTVVFAGFMFFHFGFLESVELKTYDLRAKLRQRAEPGDEIVIVDIDDDSIAKIGRWPWPRSIMAEMIQKLTRAGARVIGLTIIYAEPERNSGLLLARRLRRDFEKLRLRSTTRKELAGFRAELVRLERELDNDAKLARALSASGRVVLPMYFTFGTGLTGRVTQAREVPEYLSDNAYISIGNREFFDDSLLPPVEKVTPPIEPFARAAAAIGFVNRDMDIDGITRAEMLVLKYGDEFYPSMAVQIATKYLGLEMDQVRVLFGEGVRFGRELIPTTAGMKMLISYNGPNRTFPYFSFYDVINEKMPMDVFKDRIVLVGLTATGLYDAIVTPASPNLPGVEYMANVVQDILHKNVIVRPGAMPMIELGILLIFGIFAAVGLPRLGAKWGGLLTLFLLLAFIIASTAMFASRGIWIKVTYPSLLLMISYAVITSKRYLITEKAKEKVEADSVETNKMLGLSFQGQGMLDLAFEKFRKCPVDASVADLLYNLGLDYERKRQLNKAVNVYKYIAEEYDENFRDVQEKIEKLTAAGETMIFGLGAKGTAPDATVLVDAGVRPTMGRYEIVEELGKGAMGIVYKGVDPKIDRVVAIKTIRFDESFDEEEKKELKERFFAEARAAGKLNHPNIITIYDTGEDYDLSWIAMEFLEGEDLEKYTRPGNLLPVKKVVEIVQKVCDALDYAHQHGIVHRDVKPANIMLLKDGKVKVTDFGIARITSSSKTQTGIIMGTPSYMSPEQVAGKKVDGRSDIFSLGIVMYELLTGDKPFKGESIATLMYQIANVRHPDPRVKNSKIPEVLVKILNKALEKDLEKRYQRAKEMGDHLRVVLHRMNKLEKEKDAGQKD